MWHPLLFLEIQRGKQKKAETTGKVFDPGAEEPTPYFPSTAKGDIKSQKVALNLVMHTNSRDRQT